MGIARRWWVLVPAAIAARTAWRRRAAADWGGRVVLLVGASRGLGLALARELVAQGASVVIAARDAARLEEVAGELRTAGGEVLTVPADISDPEQARSLVEAAAAWRGRLDALVNVAGVLRVAPLEGLTIEEFEEAVDVMALGPIACTMAALPALERSDAGRVATITSVGGKLPVPHLLPYAVAKHAAVGFSESLRAELGPRGVRVTTIVPGLMRTGSHINAQVKGAAEDEYRWFATLAELPLLSMSADRAARRILAAIARGDAEASTTWWVPLAVRAHGLAPGLVSRMAALVSPLLPSAEPEDSGGEPSPDGWRRGHEVSTGLGPLSERAARHATAFRQEPERGER